MLNGRIVPSDGACLPIDERGFLYGESVFTTLRCYDGVPFKPGRHCQRLNASLRSDVVAIDYEVDPGELAAAIGRLIELNCCPDAVARFQITRGRGIGPLPPEGARPITLLTVGPYAPDASLYSAGVKLITSTVRRDPRGDLGKHKLGSYAPSLLARRQAQAAGAYEGVIQDTNGNLLECACSNLFVVVDRTVVTPDVTENLLPGIARETVLECAGHIGHEVSLEKLTPALVERANEVFITNSLIEVVPVASVDGHDCQAPGPVTKELTEAYRRAVREHS